ncbi:glucuronate isomerase [Galbibacter mesophilus]|uniref:glucuronate isomerase n=1 Tax=Galbibacter mesophilus TaxID=379069 RepID=UPI00191D4951|nr:glucuronate isomerase [Galbibacter mesophilus]MCM5663096.1 glucuronate isomerase [Galbibacter mesophilus]
MKNQKFIHDNFILSNKYAEELYHSYAKEMPIIDYHCHLAPADIARDRVFENTTKVWLDGDHYKWRAMRTLGIDEKYITGGASDKEKFQKWAETVPYTMRNPLYHWTQMELARYFDEHELLNGNNAERIYNETTEKLQSPDLSCRSLLTKMNVEVVCTTEDPIDTLEHHQKIAKNPFETLISTSFRPDKSIMIGNEGFLEYLSKLEKASDVSINSLQDLKDALKKRLDYFDSNGCKVSDHGLNSIPFINYTDAEVDAILKKKLKKQILTSEEIEKYESAVLQFLSEEYHKLGWVQQFHLGALRNNNKRMLAKLGPDTGWDSIADYPQAEKLSNFLNKLDSQDQLSKTIIYNLNPAHNEVMATMIGNFNDGSVKGKVQFGSGWWFLDQKDGMTKQMNALSNMGLISCFIGMLTDSRSFLSFPRHEYFRRLVCSLFGEDIENGELPNDMEWIGKIVQDICYHNAKEYFNF